MSERPFDSLARTLAGGASRRGVLRAIGGAVLGSLVAAPAQAVLAAGNSACAHFCAAVFGADTPAAGQCTSDAAHGKGLCYTCGPASSGGGISPSSICCARNGSGVCSSYSTATCCATGQTCTSNGQCVAPTTTTTTTTACLANGSTCSGNGACCSGICCQGTCCASGQVCLSNGTCATPCATGCAGCGGCFVDVNGESYCAFTLSTFPPTSCTTDSQCPRGQFCGVFAPPMGTPTNVCFLVC